MLLISISLPITEFLLEQRVDQDGMIQSNDRSIEHEHEHEHEHEYEYEYEKQPEQNHAPKRQVGRAQF